MKLWRMARQLRSGQFGRMMGRGLQEGFRRLSPQSIYLRFLETFSELTDEQANKYAQVDYQTTMAFVAEIEVDSQKRLIASRYAMLGAEHPGAAESAIVVGDAYQRQGLGTRMMDILVQYARSHGVEYFMAAIHLSNTQILQFIKRNGYTFQKDMLEPGVWEVRVPLSQNETQR